MAKKTGRPLELNQDVIEKVSNLMRMGVTSIEGAAIKAGFSASAAQHWRARGKEALILPEDKRSKEQHLFVQFLKATDSAPLELEATDELIITKGASKDWKAAAWRRERLSKRKYAQRVTHVVDEELDTALARLEAAFAGDPGRTLTYGQALELALAAIAGQEGSGAGGATPPTAGDSAGGDGGAAAPPVPAVAEAAGVPPTRR